MRNSRGFTLIEVTVTVAIIAILSAGILFGITEARQRARDTERVADLRTLQSAIELYKQRYGRYPEGCRGAGIWSGQAGTSYACATGNQYITGHIDTTDWDNDGNRTERFSFAPEFIPSLPNDPKPLPDAQSGYVYTTNGDGSVFKLTARRTVEIDEKLKSGSEGYTHIMKSCDATHSGTGICDDTAPTGNKPNHCQENDSVFTSTYAVWGGFARGSDALSVEQLTEDILCDIP
jgi:prepilin-type N-terminal cleavage/methylation domain-containing protein